jgi:hypothetical protein
MLFNAIGSVVSCQICANKGRFMWSSIFWDITLHSGFLLGLFFDPEDGSDMFI